jgi:uracil-DNA glycosylase family 4
LRTIFTAQSISMAVIPSPTFNQKFEPCQRKVCKSCGLYLNQGPIFDHQKKSKVFWVGLSAVRFADNQIKLPLSPITASGSLIRLIEQSHKEKISFYKTNLVKCVPLKEEKIRYPLGHEMEKCYSNFEWELEHLKPSTVFLLGLQVATFVLKKQCGLKPSFDEDFLYHPVEIKGINFIPVHHPSYVLVYKRKKMPQYIKNIQSLFPGTKSSRLCGTF